MEVVYLGHLEWDLREKWMLYLYLCILVRDVFGEKLEFEESF